MTRKHLLKDHMFTAYWTMISMLSAGLNTDAENPLTLFARSTLFAVLIGYAQAIFQMTLDIACARFTALMEVAMTAARSQTVGAASYSGCSAP